MDKRKLSKIPRPCATQRMINDAKQLESMNHMVTAELIEDKKILLLNFFRIKSLAGGNTEAEFRTFLSHEDYITQDLKTSKTKWYTASFAGMWNFSFTEYLWDPELKRSRYKVNEHIRSDEEVKTIKDFFKEYVNSDDEYLPWTAVYRFQQEILDRSYLPISVKYESREIAPGQFLEVPNVYYTGTDGQTFTLVSDTDCGSLSADISGHPVRLSITGANGSGTADITDTIPSGTLKGTLDILNDSGAFDKGGSSVNGLGYYQTALDSLVKTFAETFNALNVPVKKDQNGNYMVDKNGDPILEDDPAKMCPLFEKIDPNADFSASNIKIADGWMRGDYGITISKKVVNGEIGSTDTSNILNMINALKDPQKFESNGVSFFTGSFYDCFASLENTLAIDLKSANTTLQNQISVLNQTASTRDGVSGVQLDEEGMDLMHYNQSYTAAARLMTTLDEALDTLINKTGIVGR